MLDNEALDAAGPALKPVIFQNLRHRDGKREGRQRQIQVLQPQRRQPEQEANDKADDTRRRQGPDVPDTVIVHQDRRGIGTDPIKGAVPERELTVKAGQQVEAQDRQAVDHDLGQLKDQKAFADKRDQQRNEDRGADDPMPQRRPGPDW